MGWIKDSTQSYDYALLLVSAALLAGGVLGLYLARKPSSVPAAMVNISRGLDEAKAP
jgi:hypothetical protein